MAVGHASEKGGSQSDTGSGCDTSAEKGGVVCILAPVAEDLYEVERHVCFGENTPLEVREGSMGADLYRDGVAI